MIPKTIHYCWFGRNPKKQINERCISTWKQYCQGWEIKEWNEDNFDISSAPLYVRQAYKAKKWAKVTNYARLKVVYDNGGVYLDTDVQLLKPLDPFLQYDAYFGLQTSEYNNTGLGFGAVAGAPVLKELMSNYESIPFIKADGTRDMTTCPIIDTDVFLRHGMKQEDSFQIIENNIALLPTEILNPFNYLTYELRKTDNSYSIHWCQGSWLDKDDLMRYWLHYYYHKVKKLLRSVASRLR